MINTIFGFKKSVAQKFTRDGRRVPVTVVACTPMTVTQLKKADTDGYWALQVGFGKLKGFPSFLREIRLPKALEDGSLNYKVGGQIKALDVLKPGDIVDVSGVSIGKGFAGGVKRYHFKGGPRTHGQSNRERSPGSIGSTTTPGRVYRGKKMAGHLGVRQTTVRNLVVLDADGEGQIILKGITPSHTGSLVQMIKTGKTAKRFEPLLAEGGSLDKDAILKEQEEQAKSIAAGGESKTSEAIKKALESQKADQPAA